MNEMTREEKSDIRKRMLDLTDSHDIVDCDSKNCVKCIELNYLSNLFEDKEYNWFIFNNDNKLKFTTKKKISTYLGVGSVSVDKAVKFGVPIKGWYVDEIIK